MIILYILLGIVGAILLVYTVSALLVSPKKEYMKESPYYRFLLNAATGFILKLLRIHVHTEGMEKLPADRSVVFVSNHRSNYDPIISWYVFRNHHIAFVSKAGNFKIPWFGRIIRKCCFMAIDRKSPRAAIKTVNQAAELLKDGYNSVGIYPEGTRNRGEGLLPFHDSILRIPQKAGAPIVVLMMRGTNKIAKNIPFRRTDVYIRVLDVISAEEVTSTRSNILGTKIRKEMELDLEL